MMECLKSVLLFIGILVVLLKCSVSKPSHCPYGCNCTVNESNDGTDVVCSGIFGRSHLSFDLLRPKVQSFRLTHYDTMTSLDLSNQSITDISKIQVSDGPIKHLGLAFNHITTASLSQFNHLSNRRVIDLSNNNIVEFDTSNAQPSNTLLRIFLRKNNLTNVFLDATVFTRRNFPNLIIKLYGNPLKCRCKSNALPIFASTLTPCVTQEGQISTLLKACNVSREATFLPTDNEDGDGSSTGLPVSTPPQSSSPSISPLQPTWIPKPTLSIGVHPTSTRPNSCQQATEHLILIIGSSLAAIVAIFTIILLVLVSIICMLKRSTLIFKETNEEQMPVSYLSPLSTQAALSGRHYITESTMRLAHPYQCYEEIDQATNGVGPAPLTPQPTPVNTIDHVVIPYHVSEVHINSEAQLTSEDESAATTQDVICPPEANQYLDIHP